MKRFLSFSLFVLFILTVVNLSAQDNTPAIQKEKTSIGLSYTYPSFDMSENFDFLSGIYEVRGKIPTNEHLSVLIFVPYSTYSMKGESESTIGNLSVGLNYNSRTKDPFNFKGVLSIPTIGKSDRLIASLSAQADIWNFPRHLWGGVVADLEIVKRYYNENGLFGGFGFGNYLLIPTGDNNGDVEDFLKYFVIGGMDKENSIGFDASLRGMYMLTSDDDFDENLIHLFNIGIHYKAETVKPRLFFVLPVSENYSDLIKNLIGFEITFFLK